MTAVPMQKWWRRQAKPRVQGWVNVRNLLTFFIALGFIIIGLGVLILGWQYQDALAAMLFGEDPPPTAIPAVADGADLGLVLATATATPTMTPSATPSPTPPTATPSATPSPTAALCPLPEGWIAIALSEGVTLELLAQAYELDPAELAAQNCQSVADFGADGVVYVPVLRPTATPTAMVTTLATVSATATATAATGGIPVVEITPIAPLATAVVVACGAPSGWVLYTVQAQDNLFRIALNSGSTVAQLQQANCLGGSTHVRTGQQLYVPRLPETAVPTDTPPPDTEPDP